MDLIQPVSTHSLPSFLRPFLYIVCKEQSGIRLLSPRISVSEGLVISHLSHHREGRLERRREGVGREGGVKGGRERWWRWEGGKEEGREGVGEVERELGRRWYYFG